MKELIYRFQLYADSNSPTPLLEQKPELTTIERIAIPSLLIGVLYSAYATALAGIRYANEIRNTIFQLGAYPTPLAKLSKEQAQMLLWDDWIPVWCGNCVYSLLIGIVILWIPGFVMQHRNLDMKMKRDISLLRWCCAVLPLVGFVGNLFGGLKDISKMMEYIAKLPI